MCETVVKISYCYTIFHINSAKPPCSMVMPFTSRGAHMSRLLSLRKSLFCFIAEKDLSLSKYIYNIYSTLFFCSLTKILDFSLHYKDFNWKLNVQQYMLHSIRFDCYRQVVNTGNKYWHLITKICILLLLHHHNRVCHLDLFLDIASKNRNYNLALCHVSVEIHTSLYVSQLFVFNIVFSIFYIWYLVLNFCIQC